MQQEVLGHFEVDDMGAETAYIDPFKYPSIIRYDTDLSATSISY